MSDTSGDGNPLAKGKLGRKYFGAPLYMILLVVVAVVGYYWYKKRKANANPLGQIATAVGSSEAASGLSQQNAPSGGGGTVTTANGTPGITTNAAWSLQVSNSLVADGSYSATDVSNAISKYLNGQPLTAQEEAIINIALQRYGFPPEGVLPVTTVTPPATSTTATPSAAKTVSKYVRDPNGSIFAVYSDGSTNWIDYPTWASLSANGASYVNESYAAFAQDTHTYRVQPGDTPASIAQRLYGSTSAVNKLPSTVTAGQVLNLPA